MLLREELKSPAIYDSILQAIGAGCNTSKLIADRTGLEQTSLPFYLKTLENLRLIEKSTPFGDKATSRRTRIHLRDPFFAYWYRFVAPNVPLVETGNGRALAERIAASEDFATYVGQQFEAMCLQWTIREAAAGRLGMLPAKSGKWWGNNPLRREQTDIDLVVADPTGKRLLLGECKWRNTLNETEMVEALRERVGLIPSYPRPTLAFFTKRPVGDATRSKYADDPDMRFICVSDMFPAEAAEADRRTDG